MKVAVAQTRPVAGDIDANIASHKQHVQIASGFGADLIVFPELSITGYEPKLSRRLAFETADPRLDLFQDLAENDTMIIAIGVPLKVRDGIAISLIIFQPGKPRTVYSKKYLHPDEEPFFVSHDGVRDMTINDTRIAFAICYEISVPAHYSAASANGAEIYLASVAKSHSGVTTATGTLSQVAKRYGMTTLMANCTGHCDDFDCGGRSSAWNNRGDLVTQLDHQSEGLIIMDTGSGTAITKIIS